MSTVDRITHLAIPGDVVTRIARLYLALGKLENATDFRSHDSDLIQTQTINADAYFLGRLLELDISASRSRLIVMKDSLPRTRDENVLSRIKTVLAEIQHGTDHLGTEPRDFMNRLNYIYVQDKAPVRFLDETKSGKTANTTRSKKAIWEEEENEVRTVLSADACEPLILHFHYWLDLFNIAPLSEHGDALQYLALYVFMFKTRMAFFRYSSLFEIIAANAAIFKEEVRQASVNWTEGYAQTMDFVRLLLSFVERASADAEKLVTRYERERGTVKADVLEATILSFTKPFNKADVRAKHPLVSDSTIQRALSSLQKQGKIVSLGKGRNAKWLNRQATIAGPARR